MIILCGTLLSIDVISFENIPKGIHSISGVIIFQLNFFKNFLGSNWKVYERSFVKIHHFLLIG